MPKIYKSALLIILNRVKIGMLKIKIKKMEHSNYLNLWERTELRDAVSLLQQLEQQQFQLTGLHPL